MERRLLCIFFATFLGHACCYVTNTPRSYDTIVIGLGSAGTTAATTLARAGKRVLALEAQGRIGGRVMTAPFGDSVVEVGAEWIHGTEKSRVYDTAINNSIPVEPQDITFKIYNSDGNESNNELIEELIEFCVEAQEHPPEKPEPLGEFITRKLMDYLKEKHPEVLKDQDFVTEFLDLMNYYVSSYEATNDWNDVTALQDSGSLGGHQTMSWHRFGYKTFFELLLNTYKNGPGWPTLDIKLNKEVTSVKWPKTSTGKVEVVCKDGDAYTADNVIVTPSVGVLKERYSTLFSPAIPDEKAAAIANITIGVLGKTIFLFSEPWWPLDRSLVLFSSPADREEYKDDPWLLKLKIISSPKSNKNALTFWACGETAKLIETLPDDVVKSKMMGLLKKFIGKNHTITEPTDMIRSKWYSNPFTRGSYTYEDVNRHLHPTARAVLGEPLVDAAGTPRVLFAGEATSVDHYGTVHGASETGYREANRLLSRT